MHQSLMTTRREILKGTLASLVGTIGDLPRAVTTTTNELLGPGTGLGAILLEANVGYGSFYCAPVRQSVPELADIVRDLTNPAQSPAKTCARLMSLLSSRTSDKAQPIRWFIHKLLTMDQEGRGAAVAAIRAARDGISQLQGRCALESEAAVDIVGRVYYTHNYLSDDGFPTLRMSDRECLQKDGADVDKLFNEFVARALTSLDAEEVVVRDGHTLLTLGREYPVLGRALRCLQRGPYLPEDVHVRLTRENDAVWERVRGKGQRSAAESGQSREGLPPLTERGLIDGILDGTLERHSPEELTVLLHNTLTPSNFAAGYNDGLMRTLAEMGVVFCFDLTSSLWDDRAPQVDMIWIEGPQGYPRSFNLTYHKRGALIAALTELHERYFPWKVG